MNKKILILLADGFEEVEAITPVDLLRRLGFDVSTVSITHDSNVTSSHNLKVETDTLLSEISDVPDAIILPGGMPGAEHLKNCPEVINLIKKTYSAGKLVASICAAPIALQEAGVLKNKRVTAYPAFKEQLIDPVYTGNRIEEDQNIITGIGPGASFEFSLAIAKYLGKTDEIDELISGMLLTK